MTERLASFMAATAKYSRENGFDYWFWTITEQGKIARKKDNHYEFIDLTNEVDKLMFAMIKDERLPLVMKGDILRFVINFIYGGFYADIDIKINNIRDEFLSMPYVCGYERDRGSAGLEFPEFVFKRPPMPKPQKVVCTAFFGAPPKSQINKEMYEYILDVYADMVKSGRYPAHMWDVCDITVCPLVRIINKYPEVNIFTKEYFFNHPPPVGDMPFTIHHYNGTQLGGWSFDCCSNDQCEGCKDKIGCPVMRPGKK